MSVRTYNPSVRVGNWNEDIQLEEDMLKDFLARRERGELLIQKSATLRSTVAKHVSLSISRDGMVHFGDTVMLVNPQPKDISRQEAALAIAVSPGGATSLVGTTQVQPTARTAFVITPIGGGPKGRTVKYGEPFYICSADDTNKMYLCSERATFQKCAKKSRHNEVSMVPEPSHLTEWKFDSFDPQYRMEMEFTDVQANRKLVIVHMKTNQALCLEAAHLLLTPFGREYEVSSFTDLNSHKAEKDSNHWVIAMNVPGDPYMPITPSQSDSAPPAHTGDQ